MSWSKDARVEDAWAKNGRTKDARAIDYTTYHESKLTDDISVKSQLSGCEYTLVTVLV